ncbi:MAG: glycosyltransferase family 1 protein [Acidimicrobiia bacterium]|nr:glycosyltransferase family 1 protein [Acidimicrobiia bacterium]
MPGLRGHELNVLYSSAKIVIGDTLCKNFNYPWYFSDRLTEVPCRGGFMIFPYIRGLEMMYDIGREIVTYKYDDFEALKFKIDYYLAHEKEREEIQVVQMSGVLIQVTRTSGTNLERRHQHRHEADVLARVDAVCARVWSGLQAQSWVPDAREALADLRDHHLTKALG